MALSFVRDPDRLIKFIEANHERAQFYASQWNEFQSDHPETTLLKSWEEWQNWISKHPNTISDPEIWAGNEIQELFSESLTPTSEDESIPQQQADLTGLFNIAGLATLPFLKPNHIENQKEFKQVQKELMATWLKNHSAENFDSEEGQDFLYGSLDDPNSTTIKTRVIQELEKRSNDDPKLKKLLDRYAEKNKQTYEKHEDDPAVKSRQKEIEKIANKRFNLLQKSGSKKTLKDVLEATEGKTWTEFAHLYPEKAKAYRLQNSHIKAAYEKRELELMQERLASGKQSEISEKRIARQNQIREEKQKKEGEKQKPSENSQILHNALQKFEKEKTRPFPQPSQPLRFPRRLPQFPRIASRAINSINRLASNARLANRASQLAGRAGGRLAGAAGRAAAQAAARAGAWAGSALIGATAEFWIPAGVVVGVVVLVIIIVMFFFSHGNPLPAGPGSQQTPGGVNPSEQTIPGLEIKKTGPNGCIANCRIGNGADIPFTIEVKYSGSEDITISDPIPQSTYFVSASPSPNGVDPTDPAKTTEVSWRLKDFGAPPYTFTLIVHPSKDDIRIVNTVIPKIVGAIRGSPSGNACTQKFEGSGHCAVSNLLPYFGNDNLKALTASLICQAESTSDPFRVNDRCTPDSQDYSIGLFQINLLYHCPGAYSDAKACILSNQITRDQCANTYLNPENNIRKALELSNNGTNWSQWSTWLGTPRASGVEAKLRECGII